VALDIVERYLRDQQWLVGESITLADVALLAYTRQAGAALLGVAADVGAGAHLVAITHVSGPVEWSRLNAGRHELK
jgi:glutathione S-transferase